MDNVFGRRPSCCVDPRHGLRPDFHVMVSIPSHRHLAGGAAGGVDLPELAHRHGEHAKGVVVAQILLVGERQLGDVLQRLNVVGRHACFGVVFLVERHLLHAIGDCFLESLQLQLLQLRTRHGLSLCVPD